MRIQLPLLVLIVILSLNACTLPISLPGDIQTAIIKTESSNPTSTTNPEHGNPPTEGLTRTLESTLATSLPPTVQPSPTPTPDLRVIIGKPEDYILQKEDLPDKYILKPGWSTPHNNSEILSARGVNEGTAYLEATGRIGGWIVYYDLVESTTIAPEVIESYLVMYDNVYGSKIAKSPEWDTLEENQEIIDIDLVLGEWNRVTIMRERQSNGKYYVWYAIEFIYRNIWTEVMAGGMESDVQHDYVENVARVVLAKLETAPLGEPK